KLQDRIDPTYWPKELSNLATAYNNMLDRIEDGLTRLSQFSDDLAHELRTPITTMMSETEIGLSRPRSNEEYRQILASILEEFQHLSTMIDTLLFLARAENPRETILSERILIEQLFFDVIDFFDAIAEKLNIKIIYSAQGCV